MTLTFEITGDCTVQGADYKPNELEIAQAIESILEQELDINATIYVSNMSEE